jgi:hypothetical protein
MYPSGNRERTPLYIAFYSSFNMSRIQDGIVELTRERTGKSISPQDARPLTIIMESIFSTNAVNYYSDIPRQIEFMNSLVVKECTRQTVMGVQSYMRFINDQQSMPVPNDNSVLVSSVGNKIPFNTKIGL